jgi:hypothetical protein
MARLAVPAQIRREDAGWAAPPDEPLTTLELSSPS